MGGVEADTGGAGTLEVTLGDGARVLIRAITPADRDDLRAGFERLSPASRYLRFFTVARELSAGELSYLTDVDHHGHEALVAVEAAGGEGVGVARYVRAEDGSAELGIVVADPWQRRGLGGVLLARLAERARAEGVRCLTATVLAENVAIRRLLERLGPTRVRGRAGGTLDLITDLGPAA